MLGKETSMTLHPVEAVFPGSAVRLIDGFTVQLKGLSFIFEGGKSYVSIKLFQIEKLTVRTVNLKRIREKNKLTI